MAMMEKLIQEEEEDCLINIPAGGRPTLYSAQAGTIEGEIALNGTL